MNHQNGSDFLVFQEVLDPFGEFPEMPRWRAMPRYIHMLRDGDPAGWCPSTRPSKPIEFVGHLPTESRRGQTVRGAST
jgi:hypothetical protein